MEQSGRYQEVLVWQQHIPAFCRNRGINVAFSILHLVVWGDKAFFDLVLVYVIRIQASFLQGFGGGVVDAGCTRRAAGARSKNSRGVDFLKVVLLSAEVKVSDEKGRVETRRCANVGEGKRDGPPYHRQLLLLHPHRLRRRPHHPRPWHDLERPPFPFPC